MAEAEERVKDAQQKTIITYSRDELLEIRSLPASNVRPKGIDTFIRETESLFSRVRDDQDGSEQKDSRKRENSRSEGGMTLGPQRNSFITGCRPTAGARRQISLQEKSDTSEKSASSGGRTAGERLHIVRNEKGGLVKKTLTDAGLSGQQASRDDWRSEDGFTRVRRQGKESERWSRSGDRDWRTDDTRPRTNRHNSWREQSDYDSRGGSGYSRKNYSSQYTEEMPSWFTQGPESQDDRIDIGGFEDSDEECGASDEKEVKQPEQPETNGQQEKELPSKDTDDASQPVETSKEEIDESNLAAIPGFNDVLPDLVFSEDTGAQGGAKSRFKNFFSSTSQSVEENPDRDSPGGFNFINLDSLLVSGHRTPTPTVPDPSTLQGSMPLPPTANVPVARAPGVPPDQPSPADLTANLKRMLCLNQEPTASTSHAPPQASHTPLEPPQASNPQGARTVQELEAGLSAQQTQSNEQIAAVKQLFAMQRMQQENAAPKANSPRHVERQVRPAAQQPVAELGHSAEPADPQLVVLKTNLQRLLVYQAQLQMHGERIHHEAQQVLLMHQQAHSQQVTPPANLEANYLQLQYAYSQVRQSMQQVAAAIADVQLMISRASRGAATLSAAPNQASVGSLAPQTQANRISSPVVLSQQPPSTSVAAPTPIHPARGLGSPSRIKPAQQLTNDRPHSSPKPLNNTSKSAFSFTPTQVMRHLARSDVKSGSSSSAASPTPDGAPPAGRPLTYQPLTSQQSHATQPEMPGRALTSHQASLSQQQAALHQLQLATGEAGRPLRAVTGRNVPPPDAYAELSMQRQARDAVLLGGPGTQRPVVGASSQPHTQRPIVGAVQNDSANRSNTYYQQQQQQQQQQQLATAIRAMNQTRMSTGVAPSSYQQQIMQQQQISSAIQQQRQHANLQSMNQPNSANIPTSSLPAPVLGAQANPLQHLMRQQAAIKAKDAGNVVDAVGSIGHVTTAARTPGGHTPAGPTPGGPGGDAANNNILSALLNPALAGNHSDNLPALPSQALSLDELEATG